MFVKAGNLPGVVDSKHSPIILGFEDTKEMLDFAEKLISVAQRRPMGGVRAFGVFPVGCNNPNEWIQDTKSDINFVISRR